MPSSWSSGMMPRPPRKAATGASSSSASARTASLACCAPLPVMIIGRAAAASSLAAASTSSGEGAGGFGMAAAPSGSTKALDAIVSQAISTATAPGRPDSIWRNASLRIAGASAGRSMRAAHFVSERNVPS